MSVISPVPSVATTELHLPALIAAAGKGPRSASSNSSSSTSATQTTRAAYARATAVFLQVSFVAAGAIWNATALSLGLVYA
jgi:hypothetical protein